MSSPGRMPMHAPYPPSTAGLGGRPTKALDDPIVSVFIVLFLGSAATHMTLFRRNLARGRKFILSAAMFGFSMARTIACIMRLAWASYPTNVSLAIAAQIFVAIGVLILFIVNLIFTQRIIRATHPHIGWSKWLSWAFKLYFASIIIVIIALITCTVQSFYTLSTNTRRIDRDVMLFGATYFAVAAFLPIPLLILRAVIPKRGHAEKFGEGRIRSKVAIVVAGSTLLTLGAAFRAGTSYLSRPAANPAWYHSKACFYLFNFTIEWIVAILYAVARIDKRFIVPNGSHGPGDYSRQQNRDIEEKAPGVSTAPDEESATGLHLNGTSASSETQSASVGAESGDVNRNREPAAT